MRKNKIIKRPNGTVVVMAVAVFVVAVLVLATLLTSSKKISENENEPSYTDPTTGLSINYQSDLKLIPYVPPNSDSVLFNLTKSDPKILVTSWYSQGDEIATLNLLGRPLSQAILDNIVSQLDRTYKETEVVGEKSVEINGYEGREVIFHHVSAGLPTTQRLTVIVKDGNTAVTIACQSLREDFETINKQYFDEIMSSVTF